MQINVTTGSHSRKLRPWRVQETRNDVYDGDNTATSRHRLGPRRRLDSPPSLLWPSSALFSRTVQVFSAVNKVRQFEHTVVHARAPMCLYTLYVLLIVCRAIFSSPPPSPPPSPSPPPPPAHPNSPFAIDCIRAVWWSWWRAFIGDDFTD